MPSPRIGLVLGAGGARGLSHIGVLRGLQNAGIHPDVITGASSGAVVGAMYAARQDVDWIENRFREMLASEPFLRSGIERIKSETPGAEPAFFQWASKLMNNRLMVRLSRNALGTAKVERLRSIIEFLVPAETFEDLSLPFACQAADLYTGQAFTFTEGSLTVALCATSSIPGFLEPVQKDETLLVDGAVYQPVPIALARKLGADFTIAVDVSLNVFKPLEEKNILSIVGRAAAISSARLASAGLAQADVVLKPDTLNLHWTQFDHLDELIANGELAVSEQITNIKEKIAARKGIRGLFSQLRQRAPVDSGLD